MVQKTSMSRGSYPPSQEIPMEVFDPSPQVRRGGRDRGKGVARVDLAWADWRSTGEELVLGADTEGNGGSCTPLVVHPPGSVIDGHLAWSWAAVLRRGAGRGRVGRLSSSPPPASPLIRVVALVS